MVSVLLWWARPTVCCGALRFVESHRRDQAGPRVYLSFPESGGVWTEVRHRHPLL